MRKNGEYQACFANKLVRNLKNKTKDLKKWGIMTRKGVLLLNVEKFGEKFKNETKIEWKWGILR